MIKSAASDAIFGGWPVFFEGWKVVTEGRCKGYWKVGLGLDWSPRDGLVWYRYR
jgi:hypothetical protein